MECFPPATWRLIISPPADGATNMAIDEAIAQTAAAGKVLPTLRFYRWEPPCLSLGRHQPLAKVDLERCMAAGVDVVRRPTGGRAILHTDELTYSVAGSDQEPRLAGGVLDAYHRLSAGLVAGLHLLGIPARQAPGTNRAGPDVSPACFEVPSAYEITVHGRKLMGSAQSRRRGFVLQHGSLPLQGDVARIVDYLAFPNGTEREALRRALKEHATTVDAVGGSPDFDAVVMALAQGLATVLNLQLLPDDLTPSERELAERLRQEQYANWDWIARQ